MRPESPSLGRKTKAVDIVPQSLQEIQANREWGSESHTTQKEVSSTSDFTVSISNVSQGQFSPIQTALTWIWLIQRKQVPN